MVTPRRGILHRFSQVMKSMKWLRIFTLSLVSGKELARMLSTHEAPYLHNDHYEKVKNFKNPIPQWKLSK
jgi:hypothetical protein